MRLAVLAAAAVLPLLAAPPVGARQPETTRSRVEVTGCVKGSTLVERSVRIAGDDEVVRARRWRLRGAKAVMNRLKEHAGYEVQIVGETRKPNAGTAGRRRIGGVDVVIGGAPARNTRDPLPELPTIDVQSFERTGESCR